MKDRPFKILGVQQVAIGSKDKSKLNNLWVGLLGISVNESHTSKDENVVGTSEMTDVIINKMSELTDK